MGEMYRQAGRQAGMGSASVAVCAPYLCMGQHPSVAMQTYACAFSKEPHTAARPWVWRAATWK